MPPEPMLPLRRILAPVDFSRASDAAIRRAADLARRTGAELHLLHVVPAFDPLVAPDLEWAAPEDRAFYARLHQRTERELEVLARAFELEDLAPRYAVYAGLPSAIALAYAAEHAVDLIVMGTHGRRGARRFLLGSVATEVLHRAAVPVLVVPEGTSPRPLLHVLAPTDFSAAARLTLPVAAGAAGLYGAALTLLHVCEPPEALVSLVGAETARSLAPEARAKAATALAALAAEAAPRRAVQEVVEGHPAEAVAAFAEAHGVDLVVLAKHARGALGRFFLGSVTERVARLAPCALLAVPVDERGG